MVNPRYLSRRLARLAAVQCLYQSLITPSSDLLSLAKIRRERGFDNMLGDADHNIEIDDKFFTELLTLYKSKEEKINSLIKENLNEKWTLEKLDSVSKCVLQTAISELMQPSDMHSNGIIGEYSDIAGSFVNAKEVSFISGILHNIVKVLATAPAETDIKSS